MEQNRAGHRSYRWAAPSRGLRPPRCFGRLYRRTDNRGGPGYVITFHAILSWPAGDVLERTERGWLVLTGAISLRRALFRIFSDGDLGPREIDVGLNLYNLRRTPRPARLGRTTARG
jgi:hypothetical protein